jgi:hypothetical protein
MLCMILRYACITFFLFLSNSCLEQKTYTRKGNQPMRSIASTYKVEFDDAQWSVAKCTEESQDFCYNNYPFEDLEIGILESSDEFDERVYKVSKQYSQCVVKNSYVCNINQGQTEAAELLKNIEKEVDESGKSVFSQVLRYSRKEISDFKVFLEKIAKIMDTLNKKKIEFMHGTGVGFAVGASAGVLVDYKTEYVLHDGKVGVFCAPGLGIAPNLALNASFGGLKTFDCKTNDYYKGGFLVTELGLNATWLGLPFGPEVSYSLGFNPRGFINSYKVLKGKEYFSPIKLKTELNDIATQGLEVLMLPNRANQLKRSEIFTVFLAAYIASDVRKESMAVTSLRGALKSIAKTVGRNFFNGSSLGANLKRIANSERFKKLMFSMNYPNIYYYVKDVLAVNMSGCDAATLSAQFAPSWAPIGLGAYLSQYELLAEFRAQSFLKMVRINPFALYNPFYFSKEDAQEYLKMIKFMLRQPDLVTNKCLKDGYQSVFKNIRDIVNLR